MQVEIYNFNDVTGATHKELGVQEVIDDALKRGLEAITVISSGNYIEALREAAANTGISVYNLVNGGPRSEFDITIPEGKILRTNEERVDVARSSGVKGKVDDYTDFIPTVYSTAAEEILRSEPSYVVCPIGSGKLWVSLVRKAEERGLPTKVIGVTPEGKNAFYHERIDGEEFDLKSVADKLTAPFTKLRQEVLAKEPPHALVEATELQLRRAYRKAQSLDVICEPSGAAGFIAYERNFRDRYGISEDDKVMVVSSGEGLSSAVGGIQRSQAVTRISAGMVLATLLAGMTLFGAHQVGQLEDRAELRGRIATALRYPTGRRYMERLAAVEEKSVWGLTDHELHIATAAASADTVTLDRMIYADEYEEYHMRVKGHRRAKSKWRLFRGLKHEG